MAVDLNTIGDYSNHRDDLKRVEDLALTGDFQNNGSGTASLDTWIVPTGTANSGASLNASQLATQGTKLWGPLTVAAGATEHVDWNRSSGLFKGRQALIDEIKGDGQFRLYLVASGTNVTVTNGAVIAVISAAK